DTAGFHLEDRLHVLQALLEELDAFLAGALLDGVHAVVENRLGHGALAANHDRVDELRDHDVVELRIGKNLALTNELFASHLKSLCLRGCCCRSGRGCLSAAGASLRAVLRTALFSVRDTLRV